MAIFKIIICITIRVVNPEKKISLGRENEHAEITLLYIVLSIPLVEPHAEPPHAGPQAGLPSYLLSEPSGPLSELHAGLGLP